MANIANITASLVGDISRFNTRMQQASRAVDKAMRAMGRSAKSGSKDVELSTSKIASSIAGIITALSGVALATGFLQLADQFTNLEARMKLLSDSSFELTKNMQDIFQTAQNARASVRDLGSVYFRFSEATSELGYSQSQLIAFTETLGKAITVSGSSTVEANAALLQLSQGMASGVLRGQELNSVYEQMPIVIRLIAKELGITMGEVRKFAEQGKITTEVMMNAIANGAEEIEEKFNQIPLTVERSISILGNSAMRLVGTIDDATGASEGFASVIEGVAGYLDQMSASMDTASATTEEHIGVLDRGIARMRTFGELARGIGSLPANAFGALNSAAGSALGIDSSITGTVNEAFRQGDPIGMGMRSLAGRADEFIERSEEIKQRRQMRENVDRYVESLVDAAAAVKTEAAAETTRLRQGVEFMEQFRTAGERLQVRLDEINEKFANGYLTQEQYAIATAAIAEEMAKLEARTTEATSSVAENTERVNEAEKERLENLQDAESMVLRYMSAQERLNLELQEAERLFLSGSFENLQDFQAVIHGIDEKMASLRQENEKMEPVITGLKDAFADMFMEFAKGSMTAQEALSRLMSQLAQMAASEAFTSLIDGLFNGGGGGKKSSKGGGGLFGFVGNFIGGFFADGGSFSGGKPIVVGERGPEIITPNRAGTVIPNEDLGGMGGGGPVFNIDARGASVETVQRLEEMVVRLNGSIESRAIGAVSNAKSRNPGFLS